MCACAYERVRCVHGAMSFRARNFVCAVCLCLCLWLCLCLCLFMYACACACVRARARVRVRVRVHVRQVKSHLTSHVTRNVRLVCLGYAAKKSKGGFGSMIADAGVNIVLAACVLGAGYLAFIKLTAKGGKKSGGKASLRSKAKSASKRK